MESINNPNSIQAIDKLSDQFAYELDKLSSLLGEPSLHETMLDADIEPPFGMDLLSGNHRYSVMTYQRMIKQLQTIYDYEIEKQRGDFNNDNPF